MTKTSEKVAQRQSRVVVYLRVSTSDQATEKNQADSLAYCHAKGLSMPEFVDETISGRKPWQERKLGQVLNTLQAGDALVTPEFSRLARSTLQVLEVAEFCRRNDIALHVIKGGWTLNGSIESKAALTMLAFASEIERDLIAARTKEGLAAAKAKGKQLGRPRGPGKSKLDKHQADILEDLGRGVPKTTVARRYGTSAGNLTKWLTKRGL